MKTLSVFAVLALCLGIASAQQVLNNDSVVTMVKAGMSDGIIISTIDSQPAHFSLSVNDLIALKQAGVDDKVMAAMIAKNSPAVAPSAGVQDTDQPSAPPAPPNPPEAVPPPPPPPFHSTDGKVRIYVTDDPMFESNGMFRAGGDRHGAVAAGASHTQAGDDPRTVEIEADILKVCPAYVLASNNPDRADLVLVFRRRGGARSTMFAFGGLTGLALSAGQKVDGASLFQPDGDMVYATKKNTVEKAIRDVCAHISPPK
ncbi:MAG: hypothetical protein ACLQMO_17965 [Acidobacteriaceae bacterium]